MRNIKNKAFAAALLVVGAAIVTTGSLAYFTAEDTAHNVITSGTLGIALEEWSIDPDEPNAEPKEFVDVVGVVPGAEVSKIVTVRNTGSSEAWIRIKSDLAITLAEGVLGVPNPSLVDLDYNTEYWIESEDGYWYYKDEVAANGVTEPLFTTVSFDVGMGNIYQSSIVDIDILAQAVQTANNGNTVMDAMGWPNAE